MKEQIFQECTSADSHNSNDVSEPHEQEDWMQVSRLFKILATIQITIPKKCATTGQKTDPIIL